VILSILFAAAVSAASASAAHSASAAPSAKPAPSLPAGHPTVRSPRGAGSPNLFRPPADTSDEDPKLPPGVIRVELRDPLEHLLAHRTVELGIVRQSIAKGDTHEHRSASTDDAGVVDFTALDTAGAVAYRVTVHEDLATFAATPFRLPTDHGMHVVLHVYPVMTSLPNTVQIGARVGFGMELKDDRLQIQEEISFYNGTTAAWVPRDVVLPLPEGFTALNSMQQMSDIGVDAVAGRGARLHGTFPPGNNVVQFSWQLPYSGTESLDFEVGMPPATRYAIVQSAAGDEMKLEVAGFQDAVARSQQGERFLITEKRLDDNEAPLRSLHIALHGLPTPGPTRLVATLLAALGLASGIYIAMQKRDKDSAKTNAKRDRARILDEIDQLEVAHAAGDVGPKTYERARRELVDELASLLASK